MNTQLVNETSTCVLFSNMTRFSWVGHNIASIVYNFAIEKVTIIALKLELRGKRIVFLC